MTAQGSPHTRYRRAIETRSTFLAELAAREAGYLALPDALALIALYATEGSPKFERAAVRWLCRLGLERPDLSLRELQLAAAALTSLGERERSATSVLRELSG